MENARIQFSQTISFSSGHDLVRALQMVMSDLHRQGVNYQVRMAGDKGAADSNPVPATVVFVGPANPPAFFYPGGELPELSETYFDIASTFITAAIRTGIIDLISFRDAVEKASSGDSPDPAT